MKQLFWKQGKSFSKEAYNHSYDDNKKQKTYHNTKINTNKNINRNTNVNTNTIFINKNTNTNTNTNTISSNNEQSNTNTNTNTISSNNELSNTNTILNNNESFNSTNSNFGNVPMPNGLNSTNSTFGNVTMPNGFNLNLHINSAIKLLRETTHHSFSHQITNHQTLILETIYPNICIVCDSFIIGTQSKHWISKEVIIKHADRLSIERWMKVAQTNTINPILRSQYPYPEEGFENLLFSPRFRKHNDRFLSCSTCYWSLRETQVKSASPKYSFANNFLIGRLPDDAWKASNETCEMNILLPLMISPIRVLRALSIANKNLGAIFALMELLANMAYG